MRVWYWLGSQADAAWLQADAPSRYRVEFADARTLLLVADCNRGRAEYSWAADGTFGSGPAGLTKMGCSPESRAHDFLGGLAAASSLRGESGWLTLESAQGAMLFAADATLRLLRYDCADGSKFAIAFDGDHAALLIGGRMRVLAGQATASGMHYRDADFDFRGAGDEVSLDGRGGVHRGCRIDS
ncbi:MAG: META domain-containing protein [Xanthomonadales bacterium]|nr:hypothetical protein [Xanthomonadales bacterium]MCC6592086.1 META domain-containing protein [Xanthomonadales bacterium]